MTSVPVAIQQNDSNGKPRRRWFRFSLWTLLLFVTLVALGLGLTKKYWGYWLVTEQLETLGCRHFGRHNYVLCYYGITDKHIPRLEKLARLRGPLTLGLYDEQIFALEPQLGPLPTARPW